MDVWIQDLKDCDNDKKESLPKRIPTLEMQLSSKVSRTDRGTEHAVSEYASATGGYDDPALTVSEYSPQEGESDVGADSAPGQDPSISGALPERTSSVISTIATGEMSASTSTTGPLGVGTTAGAYSHLSHPCITSDTLPGLLAGEGPTPLLSVTEVRSR